MKTIDAQSLHAEIEQGKEIFLLDVREQNEWNACHINGSVHIPLGQIQQRMDEIPKDAEIVAYCHHGRRSEMALRLLEQNGYENTCNLQGGIDAWSVWVDPTLPRY